MQIGVRKPRVNWPLPEWDTAIARCSVLRTARSRELPLICTYARLVLPLCLHERISLQTGIGRSKIRTITIGSLIDRQHVSLLANISPLYIRLV